MIGLMERWRPATDVTLLPHTEAQPTPRAVNEYCLHGVSDAHAEQQIYEEA